MNPIRILLVDDHALMRAGVKMLLDNHDDLVVVGEAAEGIEALRKAAELEPDIVVMCHKAKGTSDHPSAFPGY